MAVSRRRRRSSASIKSSLRLFGRAARRRCVAVLALRRRRRDIALGDVLGDGLALARACVAPAAAAGGEEGQPVAGFERHAGRLQKFLLAAVAARENRLVHRRRLPALQAPRRVLDAFAVDVRRRLLQGTVDELDAESAAMPAGTAAVGAQREALDQHRGLDLLQLDRRVAYAALADRDRGGFAVFGRPPAPAAAEDGHRQEAAALALAKTADS